jgi:hypothetical protein
MDKAQEYAEVIAAEVRELEAALVRIYEGYGSDEVAVEFDGATFTDPMDLLAHYVNFCALSVEDVSARTYGENAYQARRSVEVLRTYGGPSAYVDYDGNGTATVRVYWGSDRGRVSVDAPAVDAELWEWMDALAGMEA